MKSQKESVYSAVVSIFGDSDLQNLKPSKAELQTIYQMVTDDIVAGNVAFSDEAKDKYCTPELIRTKYVPGMVSNWIRKDTRLNGGDKYVAKNPGSRAGQGDEVLKNLKALKATLTEAEHIEAVDEAITGRVAELAQAKMKTTTTVVDISKVPDSLRAKLGL